MFQRYDVIVVGGGGAGSAAAYHLARDGRRVLLLEQFQVGHVRGSSHGESRIIRHVYDSADYASLAPPAFALWRQLEAESGVTLLQMTGGVSLGLPDEPDFARVVEALDTLQLPYRVLKGAATTSALPQFRIPEGWAALEQKGAGILHAARCVQAMAARAVAHGAELREHAVVDTVQPDGAGVAVTFATPTGSETVLADHAIITAGPWAGRFFNQLGLDVPLRVTHQQVVYFSVEQPEMYEVGRCPLYIVSGTPGFYGFPIWERPGQIKVATELDDEIPDPNTPPLPPDENALKTMCELVERFMVGVRLQPTDVVTCRYTVSPDRDFIIDRHPEHPQIILASPCSGHGFKFTIVTGRLLADLVASSSTTYDSPLWRNRFGLRRLLATA